MYKFHIIFLFIFLSLNCFSQEPDYQNMPVMDYSIPVEYEIGGIEITGLKYLQPRVLINISGLRVGQKINIPGDEISQAISKYWKHGLFSDVKIIATKIDKGKVYLEIHLLERPRISQIIIDGVKKSEKEDLLKSIKLHKGSQLTDNIINNTVTIIKNHYIKKGFFNTDVNVVQKADTTAVNQVNLYIHVKKNSRVKIDDIKFEGNKVFTDKRLRRVMKKTKKLNLNIFKSSKYIESDYEADKKKLIDFYNKNGYRDAKILNDKLTVLNDKRVDLTIDLQEGDQYFFRKITWIGNTKYPSEFLNAVLGIKKGDVYNQKLLNDRLQSDDDAVSSLYMDQGYLFFSVNPVEVNIQNDSIDLEMRIYEGKPATINKVIISGNTKTNEHVIRRELYTKPGDLFSRTNIIRSVRELANLGHFDPEKIVPHPIPNQSDGTVDLEYSVVERPNDQLQVSGGWGGVGFVGTIGVKFSNFSARNMFKGKAWRPVPSGDGQTLSISAQSNGKYYQGYNISFVEPWFGGRKPNSFSISLYHSAQRLPSSYNYYYTSSEPTLSDKYFKTSGASIGLGRRLKWPDDYFTLYTGIGYQRYLLNNWNQSFIFANGASNLISLTTTLTRSSQDQLIFPRKGSNISLGLQLTPPYSLISGKDFSNASTAEKYKYIEFHKWTFKANWYTTLVGNLVLATKVEFGYLGYYNKQIGPSPFEKFEVGGSGMIGYNLYGSDIIPLRGYDDNAVTPYYYQSGSTYPVYNGNVYSRYYMEFRYLVSPNPQATIYLLSFVEGGNAWAKFDNFNPFLIKRSAGVGIRAFLPMFGMLGIDWGYPFDPPYGKTKHTEGKFQFIMGQQF
jgi:outer membrane protein insertion porin family